MEREAEAEEQRQRQAWEEQGAEFFINFFQLAYCGGFFDRLDQFLLILFHIFGGKKCSSN